MPRPILDETHIHPAIRSKVAGHQHAMVREVIAAIRGNDAWIRSKGNAVLSPSGMKFSVNRVLSFDYLR